MRVIGAYEAKTHFSQLLQEVKAKGEEIMITKNGKTIAILSPFSDKQQLSTQEALERLREVRGKIKKTFTAKEIISMRDERRR